MMYLVLAICSSALVSITMRLSEAKSQNSFGLLACNYMMCSLISVVGCDGFVMDASLMSFGTFSGFLYLASFILMQYNIQINGVVMSSTFMKLGVLVPVVASMMLYGETPSMIEVLGLLMALCAIVLLNGKSESKKLNVIPLVALLIGGGLTDFTSKVFETSFSSEWKDLFLFFVFFSALAMCLFLVLVKKQKITKNELIYGCMIGIPNYFSSRFLLLALGSMDAIVAYPTFSIATIVVVSVFGYVLFQEKLSKHQIKVMGLIFLSLILLNLS